MQLPIDYGPPAAFGRLNDYMRQIKENTASGASVCVIRKNAVVHEWYEGHHDFSPDSRPVDAGSRFHLGSVRKTYLAFAVSLAIEEGRIGGVDDFAADYLDDADPELLAGTTIRHLLTHTHGLRARGGLARVSPPGTDWSYNNAGVNLLIEIVRRVFGRPLAEVLGEYVFAPLGFAQTGWSAEAEPLIRASGPHGGDQSNDGDRGEHTNLFASTRELAYWGYLHLTKGLIGGRQWVPAGVFERATSVVTPQSMPDGCPRNGFFWWVQDRPSAAAELGPSLPSGSFQSLGVYGAALLVIPALDAVAVRMLNQGDPSPPGYDYLADIRGFGDLVCEELGYASMKGSHR